ncbi:hypothetical protein BN7_3707 [Wickerhamomyces ciferrii]|uniref:Uncharacterized protein n=1 Tax=Wickerhamomyces ciferrii (strain ATCC 14091 / BCRC 22168 / CBS 111 / JCM 3599 / NBRC 0793 / NRRL Y-1031 F-60-10) TaxID=1206466 RepID=K0KS37_WICCF|nr:uncharacterized protein BN7_3707 [Wickerhamomyces ciferrii]CCH44149.1 hypothetical protein BN7_3707 [Wickerhamomyces ciferrii]
MTIDQSSDHVRITKRNQSIRNGFSKLKNLNEIELYGTVCLVPYVDKNIKGHIIKSCQSYKFLATVFDPRTSIDFKKDEVFDIVNDGGNIGFKRISLQMKIKDYPTLGNKQDLEDIRLYLKSSEQIEIIQIYMKDNLQISDFFNYLNKFGIPYSDYELNKKTMQKTRDDIPNFLISTSHKSNLPNMIKLLRFYSESLKIQSNDYFKLACKINQKLKSNLFKINDSNPQRNIVYFFEPNEPGATTINKLNEEL